jgi:hypothetical protein
MAELQPSDIHEGAAEPHAPAGTSEDRKAAAALSTLDAQEDAGPKKEVDSKAIDKAMKDLVVSDNKALEKKTVKVEAADVKLLVCSHPVARLRKPYNLHQLTQCRSLNSRFRKRKLPSCYVRTTQML